MLQHSGQTLSIYDLAPLGATASDIAATPTNVTEEHLVMTTSWRHSSATDDRPDPNLRPSTSDGATSLSVDPVEITQCESLQYLVSPHDIAPYPKGPARKKVR